MIQNLFVSVVSHLICAIFFIKPVFLTCCWANVSPLHNSWIGAILGQFLTNASKSYRHLFLDLPSRGWPLPTNWLCERT